MRRKRGRDWRKGLFLVVAVLVVLSMVVGECLYLMGPV